VAGRRATDAGVRLSRVLPEVYGRLEAMCGRLEALFGDAQDFEFTLQSGMLWLLQSRAAKRTPWAALRIAVDLVEEGLLTPSEGRRLLRGIDPASVVRTRFTQAGPALAWAQAAGLGVAGGRIALDSDAAERMAADGPVILVRQETLTEDIAGMARAAGILTGTGSRTSHAAVVARQLGKVCLVACEGLAIDLAARTCSIGGREFAEGAAISLDGNAGTVHAGLLDPVIERPERELAALANWEAG
jgi:pyruvate, orthophosphate dikinase